MERDPLRKRLHAWFQTQGWTPFPFQEETWDHYLSGRSGLIHAPTGLGKTYAAWGGPLLQWMEQGRECNDSRGSKGDCLATPRNGRGAEPIRVLWITPLRALAADTVFSLQQVVEDLGLPWTVGLRTGDTSSSVKQRQRKRMPSALVTTPESLSLLLSYPDWRRMFKTVECVVVDEWHELMGTKRGVQTELALTRLRAFRGDKLRIWGLSATLGNLGVAMDCLLGKQHDGVMVRGVYNKKINIETLIPEEMDNFPWSGHLGIRLLPQVIACIEKAGTTLVFTNTRSQTEVWFQAILAERPDWAGLIAAHHGSIEKEIRDAVERDLDSGKIKAVVCTSSLDLGVDFTPVDQVIQIGSPKGIARLMQRAGRSGHQPGATSQIVGVPTNALELIEFAAARDAMKRGAIEAREPIRRPLDVLVQHIVSCALGGGFDDTALYEEVRRSFAYADLTREEWNWAMDFNRQGGKVLRAYPEYSRIRMSEADHYVLDDRNLAQRHRLSIGTITSDSEVLVRLQGGRALGSVEESFISRLRPGDTFNFAGRKLELIRLRSMTATVKVAKRHKGVVPSWQGGRSPLSTELAEAVRLKLEQGIERADPDPEMEAAKEILRIQNRWSQLPHSDYFLVEHTRVRNGTHICIFTFAGRLVNEGLAALAAFRLSQTVTISLRLTPNDYGFSLMTNKPFEIEVTQLREMMKSADLLDDLMACMNTAELAKRQFREIARVAGLVMQGYPGRQKTNRQLQTSSSLLFEVFERYDPENLLLTQAKREILERQLELTRLRKVIQHLEQLPLVLVKTERLTPLAFPLWADQIGHNITSESRTDRIQAMLAKLEQTAEEAD